MAKYYYSNLAIETTLAGSVTSGATTISVTAATGFPVSFPYVLALGYEATDEELVKVTAASGTSLTVERGFGGTSAQSHSLGAVVRHVYNAQDATDFRTHEETGADTHGVTGEIVGTGDTQTLANKTLTAPTVQSGTLSGTFTGAPECAGDISFTGTPTFSGNATFTGGPDFTTTAPSFIGSAADSTVLRASVTAEAEDRLRVGADGQLSWGDGTAAQDVTFGRRDNTDGQGIGLATGNSLWFTRPTGNHDIIDSRVEGDDGLRFGIEADGSMFWGDGTSTTADTSLLRTGPRTLELNASVTADVDTSSSFSVTNAFTLVKANHRKTCGLCYISVYATSKNRINGTGFAGNIDDTPLGTLPAGFRPEDFVSCIWSNGFVSGEANIGPDGTIQLRTSDADGYIDANTNIRLNAVFIP